MRFSAPQNRGSHRLRKAVLETLEGRVLLSGTGLIDVQFSAVNPSLSDPTQTDAAATGLSGDVWNNINILDYGQNPQNPFLNTPVISNVALNNTSSDSTGVTLTVAADDQGNNGELVGTSNTNSPFQGETDDALMDQGLSAAVDPTVTFAGLPLGKSYNVYLESDGDEPGSGFNNQITSTQFEINGDAVNAQTVYDPNGHGYFAASTGGINFALFNNVAVDSSGQLSIQFFQAMNLNGILNGIQLQPPGILAFTGGPYTANAGDHPQITVLHIDSTGGLVDDGSVSLNISGQGVNTNIVGDDSQLAGSYIFNLPALTSAGQYSLSAFDTYDGLSQSLYQGTQEYINVNPGSPSQLVFTTQPTSGSVNSTLTEVDVSVEDPFGNLVDDNGTIVSLEISSGGPADVSNAAAPTVQGVAEFTGLSIDQPGTFEFAASDQADGLGLPVSTFISDTFTITSQASGGTLFDVEFVSGVLASH